MSRGPGNVQDEVLSRLRSTQSDLTVESLQWAIFETGRGATSNGDLPNAFYKSFLRAVKRLEETSRINVVRRRLKNMSECEAHYSSKTLNGYKRALRKRFLPMLRELIGKDPDFDPRYTAAERESYHRKHIPEEAGQRLKARWQALSETLRPLYGSTSPRADELLLVICRGRQLFDTPGIEASTSLGHAIGGVVSLPFISASLALELQEFYQDFLSHEQSEFLRLKSEIGGIASIGRNGEYPLMPKTLAALYSQDAQFIEAMPGFKKFRRETILPDWQEELPRRLHKYPDELVFLFDPTVFQKYKFISLPL